jgi:hypothetical protein
MELSELTQARRIMRTFDVIVIDLGGMGSVIGEVVREMFLNGKTTLDISPFGMFSVALRITFWISVSHLFEPSTLIPRGSAGISSLGTVCSQSLLELLLHGLCSSTLISQALAGYRYRTSLS